ncbi:MAG: IS3 family transposase, partial [Actinomyces sp.]
MVTPDRRRIAVGRLQDRFGVSERRACRVVGQHRSTQRRPKAEPDDAETEFREWLRDFARAHPRWGWRKAHHVAAADGLATNPKRTRRLWRDEGLQRPPQRRCKRRRLRDGTAARLRAECPSHVWALDFQFDETAQRRRLKLLNVVDEFTRECLAIEVAHSIGADHV